jgi:signal transduction histidine kinase
MDQAGQGMLIIPNSPKNRNRVILKRVAIVICMVGSFLNISAQNEFEESSKKEYVEAKDDTTRLLSLADMGYYWRYTNMDSAIHYAKLALSMAEQLKYPHGEAYALSVLGTVYREKGDYPTSLQLQLRSQRIAEMIDSLQDESNALRRIGMVYTDLKYYEKSIDNFRKALKIDLHIGYNKGEAYEYLVISQMYINMNNADSGGYYIEKAAAKIRYIKDVEPEIYSARGSTFWLKRNKDSAMSNWTRGLKMGLEMNHYRSVSSICFKIGNLYKELKKPDSSIFYAKKGLENAKKASYEKAILQSSSLLFELYDSLKQPAEALVYSKIAAAANDSLYGERNINTIQKMLAREDSRQAEIQAEKASYQSQLRQIMLATGMGAILIIAIILYRNNRKKQQTNFTLARQKAEIQETLARLTSAQGQLETKNRELEIESSLERLRSRANAMVKSEELQEIVQLVYEQLIGLHFKIDSATFLVDFNVTRWTGWSATPGNIFATKFFVPDLDHPANNIVREAISEGREFYTQLLTQEEKNKYVSHFFQHLDGPANVESRRKTLLAGTGQARSGVLGRNVILIANNYNATPFTEEENAILKRFGNTFDQIYTRYLDIQKAEAQAREARIEYSLEKLRSKTMAMHNSQDVADATATMFKELEDLGVETLRCGILIGKENFQMEVWTAKYTADGKIDLTIGSLDMTLHPLLVENYKAWLNKKSIYSYLLEGSELISYYEEINKTPQYPSQFQLSSLPIKQFSNSFYFSEGRIYVFTEDPLSDEAAKILERFAGVFALTYRRFQDLQKAEFQAQEAIIEAAIEKVRGKAMAMRSSQDLSSTAAMVFTEVRKLGISLFRAGVGIIDEEARKLQAYTSSTSAGEESLEFTGWVELTGHPVLEKVYESWQNKKDFFPVLSGEEIKTFYDRLSVGISVPYFPDWKSGKKLFGYHLILSVGILYGWSEYAFAEAELNILKRFAAVIDLTFRRYFELQQSETNEREAVRQASLDRVRAEIASMRTTNDLDKIIPLIWTELIKLGIHFVRCGVFIMDETRELMHSFLSTPEGHAIASVDVLFGQPGKLGKIITQWLQNEPCLEHWQGEDFNVFADILLEQGAIKSKKEYFSRIPKEGIFSHCIPFLQGMLYVGNTSWLEEDEINLIQTLADAFSTAYSRYEDFNKLESAKLQVEKSLADLKSAQSLLIQSEKMASLGEMTAGIAHEIQNPLNFVNNFSEVNAELTNELREFLKRKNYQEAKRITDEIEMNEQKIIHHGRRADSIVKNMLLHSRASAGQKELTDINALAGEYLRLAFHGLRAKDKAFNAIMNTEFDKSIGKVNIISQDMGRVLLNVYNNAFYALAEKRKKTSDHYEPTIIVITKKSNEHIEIIVKDNGTGMPKKVQEKIFQPFFTTKPAGDGTGLGLSLSYDIIKAHGGEIKVSTNENEGSEFMIQLPLI